MRALFTGSRNKLFKDESSLFGDDGSTFLNSDQTLAAVYRAMRDLDHECEGPRSVGFMEDLSEYDLVIAEASVSDTHGQDWLMGLLWSAYTSPTVLVVGHWDVRSIYGSYATLARKPEKMFGGFVRYFDSERYQRDIGMDWAIGTLQEILSAKVPSMINAYPWGDHGLLAPKQLTGGFRYFLDPTSYVTSPRATKSGSARRREWITGTYEPFTDRQFAGAGASWPHTMYGCEKNGHPKLPPEALYSALRGVWGSMVHKYHHEGSGYYRSRYQQLANLGTIAAVLGPKDRSTMGEPYRYSVREIESMDDNELEIVADDQFDWFYSNTDDRDEFLTRLQIAVEEVSR